MGMNRKDMQAGMKCFVVGPVLRGNRYTKTISTYGEIIAEPSVASRHVTVHLEKGPSGHSEFAQVPICCVYETAGRHLLNFTDEKRPLP